MHLRYLIYFVSVVWFLCEFHVQSLRCITGIISFTLGNDKTYNYYETQYLSLFRCGEMRLSARVLICRCPLAQTWLYLDKFLFSVHNSVSILQIHASYSYQSSASANHTKLLAKIASIVNVLKVTDCYTLYRAQWLRGRASDSRLREPGFESWLRC